MWFHLNSSVTCRKHKNSITHSCILETHRSIRWFACEWCIVTCGFVFVSCEFRHAMWWLIFKICVLCGFHVNVGNIAYMCILDAHMWFTGDSHDFTWTIIFTCCQSSECWWLNEQQRFWQTAISSARNRRIHLSSPRTVAVVQGLLMKACTSVLTASYVSGHGSRRIWKQQAWHRCAI